jgi:hypothetical protein
MGGMRWRRGKVPSECETRAAAPLTLWRCSAGSRRRSARRRFPVQGCSTEVHSASHVCLFATYRPGSCCLRCAPPHFPARPHARPPARPRPPGAGPHVRLRGVCAVYGSTSTFQRRAAATTRRRTGATPRARTGRRSSTSGRSAAAESSRYENEF